MTDIKTYKAEARRLREALAAGGNAVSHGQALDLVARLHGARDWNTLAAEAAQNRAAVAAEKDQGIPFQVGDAVRGTFNGAPAAGRVIGMEETIKPDLWRATIKFEPPVDVVTSTLFEGKRRRITMVVGSDGRSRRLNGTETGVMAVARA